MQRSSRPKAYATAKPRAPDGKQTRTALDHSLTLRIAASREAAIVSGTGPVLAMTVRFPPVPKHPGTALMRRMNGSTPAADTGPGASGSNRHRRFGLQVSLANAGNKTPPGFQSEGVRVASGDRGDRSPVLEEVSLEW